MEPSYEQNTTQSCEIHGTVNLRFKPPVHEAYKDYKQEKDKEKEKDTDTEKGRAAVPKPHHGISDAIRMQCHCVVPAQGPKGLQTSWNHPTR